MRRLAALVVLLAALAVPAGAQADVVVVQDLQGRSIRFDVRAENVSVEWYADLLRSAAHGDEIATVTIRIVPRSEVESTCGAGAGGCYNRRLMVVPAGEDAGTAHTLLHEYGHHVDRSQRHAAAREPNGTRRWWRARGLARLVELGSVARDYSLGWDRGIAEIFAEDYAQLNLDTNFRIGWLEPPDESVRSAIRQDLGLEAPPPGELPEVAAPALRPVVIVQEGRLGSNQTRALPFGLLGPGRRVTFTAQVSDGRGRLEVHCDGRTVARRLLRGARTATIDARNLGPARCEARVTSTSSAPQSYTVRLRLTVVA